jgi:hypothetical protein
VISVAGFSTPTTPSPSPPLLPLGLIQGLAVPASRPWQGREGLGLGAAGGFPEASERKVEGLMAAGSSSSKGGADVEDLLSKLKLSEEEQAGVFLAKEERSSLPEMKWLAVARVLTAKSFSDESLKRTMMAAWNTAREVAFRPIGKNLYTVQAFCLGDWKRITEEGPWLASAL